MNYIKNKDGKKALAKNTAIRGNNILKHKEKILNLEKEGSRKQEMLKKCLEDAIEDCIRMNSQWHFIFIWKY